MMECDRKSNLSLDYIGSKKSLLCKLDEVFEKLDFNESTVFGDLFAGTGAVSRFVSRKYNCKVVANDLLYFAYVVNKAKLTRYSKKNIELIQKKIDMYNKLNGKNGEVSKHFAPPLRKYFTNENAAKIDAIREQLKKDKQILPKAVYFYLMGAFISAVDKVSNVSVVYAAYLKEFKSSALKPLHIEFFDPQNQVKRNSIIYNKDAKDVEGQFDVVYLDPPYNTRQYGDNYHVLESIASDRPFVLFGKTGLPENIEKSDFAKKSRVETAFKQLIENLNTKVIVISYSSDGILSKKDLMNMLKKIGPTSLKVINYKKFKAQNGVKNDKVSEYIFVCRKNNV